MNGVSWVQGSEYAVYTDGIRPLRIVGKWYHVLGYAKFKVDNS